MKLAMGGPVTSREPVVVPPGTEFEPIRVVYDLEARLLGRRYLLCAKDNQPGYTTIPVED